VTQANCDARDIGCLAKCLAPAYEADATTEQLAYCSVYLNDPLQIPVLVPKPTPSSHDQPGKAAADMPHTAMDPELARIVFIAGTSVIAVVSVVSFALCLRRRCQIAQEDIQILEASLNDPGYHCEEVISLSMQSSHVLTYAHPGSKYLDIEDDSW